MAALPVGLLEVRLSLPLQLSATDWERPLGGRLRYFLPAWREVTRDPWIWQAVKGVELEVITDPVQTRCPPRRRLSAEHNGSPVAGSGELGGEGGRCSAARIIQPQLHERAIRHPQSGWTASSRNRPQGTEHVSSTSSLQDGGHPSAAGPSATGRFHDEGGLK